MEKVFHQNIEPQKEVRLGSFGAEKPIGVRLFENPESFSPDAVSEVSLRKEIIKNLDENDIPHAQENLTKFLESDPNNGRIILYLPFEVLPEGPESKFAKAYKDAWLRLLFESEPRACFSDGDVLEPGMGEPERIRKAAHLVPNLLEKQIISASEVLNIIDVADDDELQKSLVEGLMVAADKNLFDIKDLGNIEFPPQKPKAISKARISVARVKWEASVRKNKLIEEIALSLSEKIACGDVKPKEIEMFQAAGIRAVFKVIENMAGVNRSRALEIFEGYKYLIEKGWNKDSEEKEEVARGLNHIVRLGIAQTEYAKKVGVEIPDLSSPFPERIDKFENSSLAFAAERISSDEFLSKYLFPVVLAYGSRVKGYASVNADLDAAVFFKPETPIEMREMLLSRLNTVILEVGGIDRLLEYWMSEKDGKYGLKPKYDEAPDTVVSAPQIHFLFGGVWVGDKNVIKKLSGDIAGQYLDLSRVGNQKEDFRMNFLRMIELDQLQFRLMHKGYRRLYPSNVPERTKHSSLIDVSSDFWDPGYRKIATKLFLSRVFLPDLS